MHLSDRLLEVLSINKSHTEQYIRKLASEINEIYMLILSVPTFKTIIRFLPWDRRWVGLGVPTSPDKILTILINGTINNIHITCKAQLWKKKTA